MAQIFAGFLDLVSFVVFVALCLKRYDALPVSTMWQ